MGPDRLRWTDSRLDDKFETVTGELRSLRDVPKTLGEFTAEVKVELTNMRRDIDNSFAALREHRNDFQTYVEEQDRTHEAHRLERKTDRRWMIGTVLTSAGLVIAAMALLIGHIG